MWVEIIFRDNGIFLIYMVMMEYFAPYSNFATVTAV